MRLKFRQLAGIVLLLAISASGNAWAGGDEEKEKAPPRAVWVQPFTEAAPWLDMRANDPAVSVPQIVATGSQYALIRNPSGAYQMADGQLRTLGTLAIPETSQWIGMDGKDRILLYDGQTLRAANSWQDAQAPEGFFAVLEQAGLQNLSTAGDIIAYVRDGRLHIVNLDSGLSREVTLADFLDDAKAAAMTPEAVTAAEEEAAKPAKNKKQGKKDKSQPAEAQPEPPAAAPDVPGVWVRPDNTVVVRVRRMLTTRTFVSMDLGRSWSQLEAAPGQLVQQGGWIWDGDRWVLSKDGSRFVEIDGDHVDLLDRFTMTRRAEVSSPLPRNWISRESPDGVMPAETDQAPDARPQRLPDPIVHFRTEKAMDLAQPLAHHYQPAMPQTGTLFGLYRDASCPENKPSCAPAVQKSPSGWMITPDGVLSDMKLPDGCAPAYVGQVNGLGLALCASGNAGNELLVYTRTADRDWVAETLLPGILAQNTEIISAPDGSVAIAGDCATETITEPAAEEGAEPLSRDMRICRVAVRMPQDLGQPDIWRVEALPDPQDFAIETNGRLLVIDRAEDGRSRLVMRERDDAVALVQSFDPGVYRGLVLTQEGCLALYDGTVAPDKLRSGGDHVRLLSVEGGLAGLDCATSEILAEQERTQEADPPSVGDDRYGMRLGAGAFFAQKGVHTWFMRAEALIPIFGGQYEVGLMYRMGGGNKSSAMGHMGVVSIRWRYDGLESFDFAVGAGIGFGQMCGYSAPASNGTPAEDDTGEDEENTEEIPESGYKRCSNASMRYEITGFATYHLADQWKLYISAELLGGSTWGIDVGAGIEVRF